VSAFAGQVAVVTGASSGVGSAIALALSGAGASVCLVGRDPERLESSAEAARSRGGRALSVQTELTSDAAIAKLAARVEDELGHVHILVHAAAVIELGPIEQASLDDLDGQYRVNVRAPYALTQALLPAIRRAEGQVVFINSTAGVSAAPGSSQYAASKHGLKAIADSLRAEVNADRVRVLTVLLGRTATPMQATVHETEGRPYRPELLIQPDDVAQLVTCALALPRTAEVTEIAVRPLAKS
jgi:NADP-dependent 3-hydroxy acid dehydrogenase YdfG